MQRQLEELTAEGPEVSVVMGIYNGALHLHETVASVLSQEGVQLEFVLVDDGSTDETANILSQYARNDSRVRVITQEQQGLTRALINGCAAARGKYIARHDVGDKSHPLRLSLQKQALDSDGTLAFVSCWTECCGPEWEFLFLVKGTGRATSPTFVISDLEEHGVIDGPTSHSSAMFRKNLYQDAGGYRAEFYYGQDWDLWYRLAELGKFQIIEQTLYRSRVLPGSISVSQKERQKAIAELSRAALRQRRAGLSEEALMNRASLIRPQQQKISRDNSDAAGMYFVGECLRRNGDDRALDYFKRSIRSSPFLIKSWIRILQQKFNRNRSKIVTASSTERSSLK